MAGVSQTHRFAHEAMTTLFEMVMVGEDAGHLRGVAQVFFNEIDRCEGLLSRFNPCSDVGQINLLRQGESVRISIDTFECLRIASRVCAETGGAFDVTVGPLVRCWRYDDGKPRQPTDAELDSALACMGTDRLVMRRMPDGASAEDFFADADTAEDTFGDPPTEPVAFCVGVRPEPGRDETKGVEVDLGGIGKGFALDKMAEMFEEWDLESALIHGGTSTALAVGSGGEESDRPAGQEGWAVGVGAEWGQAVGLERIFLRNRALSGSGTEIKGEHVIDPRTGRPAQSHLGAWASAPSATVADALSTAFLVMSTEEVEAYCLAHPEVWALVAAGSPEEPVVRRFGEWA